MTEGSPEAGRMKKEKIMCMAMHPGFAGRSTKVIPRFRKELAVKSFKSAGTSSGKLPAIGMF
jgi:hypothetical protein